MTKNKQYIPFTYLIGWSKHNIWYYGMRYAQNTTPDDLWSNYFTSSKYVKNFRIEYGEPDVIQVRKTFTTKEAAIKWEHTVLKRLKVLTLDKWLNKNIGGTKFYSCIKTPAQRKKQSIIMKAKFRDNHHLIVNLQSNESKAKNKASKDILKKSGWSHPIKGKTKSSTTQEVKEKQSISAKKRFENGYMSSNILDGSLHSTENMAKSVATRIEMYKNGYIAPMKGRVTVYSIYDKKLISVTLQEYNDNKNILYYHVNSKKYKNTKLNTV